MTELQMRRYLFAQLVLAIWNPELWHWFPNRARRDYLKLKYKAIGIVYHDRELNGEITWH